ncbi:MAG: aldehyde dehydrogenase family protein [Bacteroidia bacterium]|nr:aldehyde dehydrogenase family protein [Bacteroidia bacterium]
MEQTEKKKSETLNGTRPNGQEGNKRVSVRKTYKLYIDGKFPRSESGRYYALTSPEGEMLANICRSSRKDFRDAVVAARKAQPAWASRSAFNKGQILYRLAEILEGRTAQFTAELVSMGVSESRSKQEIQASIDRLVYYAGWTDKFHQVFSSVNPVESSHFNFSVPEPTGVVSIIAPEENGLLGLVSVIAPAIAGGNTVAVLASSAYPLTAITFAEVVNSSDVPAGVVNILTGYRSELLSWFSNHMDVNAVVYCGSDAEEIRLVGENASLNVKRPVILSPGDWYSPQEENPYRIMELQEVKTTWHPIGQ